MQDDYLTNARNLFMTVIEQALADARNKSRIPIDRQHRDKALEWFFSPEFKHWCDICNWDHCDFQALKRQVAEIEEEDRSFRPRRAASLSFRRKEARNA